MTPALLPVTITPVPASSLPLPTSSLAVVLPDDRAVGALIALLLERSGVPQAEIARRLGIKPQTLNQYVWLRRKRPSIQWIVRLAQACGATIKVEFGNPLK